MMPLYFTRLLSGTSVLFIAASLLPAAEQQPPSENNTPGESSKVSEDNGASSPRDIEIEATTRLLESDKVVLDLKITEEQRGKVQELIQSVRDDLAKLRSRLPEQRDAALAAVRLKIQSVLQEYRRKLEDILTPEQDHRLREIVMQVRGMTALKDADIAQALKLTTEQQSQVQELSEIAHAARGDLIRSARGSGRAGRIARREKVRELRTSLNADLKALLTSEQLARYEKLKGAHFDVSVLEDESDSVQLGAPAEIDDPAKKK